MADVRAADAVRFTALEWAATFRGATNSGEAIDWMVTRGLIDYDPATETVTFTDDGIERADALVKAMQKAPEARAKRRRGTLVALAAAAVGVWAWRR